MYKSFYDKVSYKYGISDASDSIIIEPEYSYSMMISDNIAAVNNEWHWQLIDCKNKSVLMDSLGGIGQYKNGISAVINNENKILLIDTLGRVVKHFSRQPKLTHPFPEMNSGQYF